MKEKYIVIDKDVLEDIIDLENTEEEIKRKKKILNEYVLELIKEGKDEIKIIKKGGKLNYVKLERNNKYKTKYEERQKIHK